MKTQVMLILVWTSCVSYGTDVYDALQRVRCDLAVTVDVCQADSNRVHAFARMTELFYERQQGASNSLATLGLLLQTSSVAQTAVTNELFALIRAQRARRSLLTQFNDEALCSRLALALQQYAPAAYLGYARAVLTSPVNGTYPDRMGIFDDVHRVRFVTSNTYDRHVGELYVAVATSTNNLLNDRICAVSRLKGDTAAARALDARADIAGLFDRILPPGADMQQQIAWKQAALCLRIRPDAMVSDLWSIADNRALDNGTRLYVLDSLEAYAVTLPQTNDLLTRVRAKRTSLLKANVTPSITLQETDASGPETRELETSRP